MTKQTRNEVLKDNLDVNSIYPTSSATVYQDTVAAMKGLKNGGECYSDSRRM